MFSLRRTATASPAAPSAVSTTDVPLDGRDERVEPLVRAFTRLCQIRYLRLDRSDPCVVALLYFGKLNLGFHKFTVPSRQRDDGFGGFAEGVIVSVKSLVDPLNVRGKLRLLLQDELHSSFHFFMGHGSLPIPLFHAAKLRPRCCHGLSATVGPPGRTALRCTAKPRCRQSTGS